MARTFTRWLYGAACATLMLGLASTAPFAQDNQLARTPPMGWNDCFKYACAEISDRIMRANTDALVNSGMKAAGYEYVNLDGCWQGKRDAKGFLHPNERFPDMKALADYIHSKGLKFGLYSSPGPKDCEDYEGSYCPRGSGRTNLRRVGRGLPKVRLVRWGYGLQTRGDAGGLSEDV